MTRILTMAATIAAGLAPVAAPMPVAAQKLSRCYIGQKVVMGGGAIGTVIAVEGTGCKVKYGMMEGWWAASGLTPAAPPPRAIMTREGGAPTAGSYQCYGGAAGNMKLRFGGGNTYSNEQGATGAYRMRPSGQMEFVSGPWKGFYAKRLEPGKVGLTSRPDGTFYNMTCDLR